MEKLFDWFRRYFTKKKAEEPAEEESYQDSLYQEPMEVRELPQSEWETINLEVPLQLNIPIGFQFSEDEIMKIYFSMDYSALQFVEETIEIAQDINFVDESDQHFLQCIVPIGKYYASGPLFYNVVVEGAEPIEFLDGTMKTANKHNQCATYQSTTGFSYYDTVIINQKIGYGCAYQNVKENYVFHVIMGTPFVFDEDGNAVPLEPVLETSSVTPEEESIQPIIPEEAKCYGVYYGNKYLVSESGSHFVYIPCRIVVEPVFPVS